VVDEINNIDETICRSPINIGNWNGHVLINSSNGHFNMKVEFAWLKKIHWMLPNICIDLIIREIT